MNKQIKKTSWLDFIIYFIVKVKNDDIFAQAAQLAYYLVLAFFPFLIFLINLIGYSNRLNASEVLLGLQAILPSSVFELTESIIVEIITTQSTGLLGASVLLTIWTASSGFRAVIKGVNRAYNIKETRSFFKRILIAIFSILALAITIILALTMLVFGNVISRYMQQYIDSDLLNSLWNVARYIFIVLMMVIIFIFIYRYAPAQRVKWGSVVPGAIFTTIGWIGVSLIFAYYIDNFSNYSRLYGSLGAVFALMTWLYITSMIFTLGVEINSVLVHQKNIR
ncbi:MAG: YihY/virulence factor BrkB family protein [Clostridium sp.]